MGARKKDSLQKVLELSIPERILAVEEIWDSIACRPESVPVTKAQREELDYRLQNVSLKSSPWPQVKQRIQSKTKK
jgi:putative addiction module component (TIGR02574 family)